MKVIHVAFYYSNGTPTLMASVEKVMDGKRWTTYAGFYGDEAQAVWDSWGVDNDKEIVEKIIAKAK